ncbi:DUF4411 family protein [candidate division CSSED10-310 bacterium]|uniref:DUF4411 family protein n=1 Tax=candidate division CSSED10-310 bacterium TaxID=2855610 RepID=A0ABV6YSD7_UNCC1
MSGRHCIDANVFITAWYINYPPHILSSLWKRIAECRNDIEIIKPVFDEIEPISSSDLKLSTDEKRAKYPLRIWLEEANFPVPRIDNEVNRLSLVLEREYEISNESKGAGQVDITLIAYAKVMKKTVVTLESQQPQKPGKKSNYKIPLICREQHVDCISFVTMLAQLGIRI